MCLNVAMAGNEFGDVAAVRYAADNGADYQYVTRRYRLYRFGSFKSKYPVDLFLMRLIMPCKERCGLCCR